MAILERLSLIFEMEEYRRNRQTECDPKDVSIQVNNCSFSWGFRVKEDQKKANRGNVLIEEDEKPIISEIDFKLKYNDHLIVVG